MPALSYARAGARLHRIASAHTGRPDATAGADAFAVIAIAIAIVAVATAVIAADFVSDYYALVRATRGSAHARKC